MCEGGVRRERERETAGERAARLIPLLSQHLFCESLFWRGERYRTGEQEKEKRTKSTDEGAYRGKEHIIQSHWHVLSPSIALVEVCESFHPGGTPSPCCGDEQQMLNFIPEGRGRAVRTGWIHLHWSWQCAPEEILQSLILPCLS